MRESKKKYAEFAGTPNNSSSTGERIDWEMRPGGMLVQKRDGNAEQGGIAAGPLIRVRVSFGAILHEVNISAYATFGDLKKALVNATGLQTKEQRILYRGKEKDSGDFLHLVGVKDKAKVVLIEDPESRERKLEETRHNERVSRSTRAVSAVKSEVDKLAERVLIVETDVHDKHRVPEAEFDVLTEKLMMQLLRLDGIEAFGDAKIQHRVQVRRVQKFVEALDVLKVRNTNPTMVTRGTKVRPAAAVIQATTSPPVTPLLTKSTSSASSVVTTTQWETFDGTSRNSDTPPPRPITTAIETDWERALFSLN